MVIYLLLLLLLLHTSSKPNKILGFSMVLLSFELVWRRSRRKRRSMTLWWLLRHWVFLFFFVFPLVLFGFWTYVLGWIWFIWFSWGFIGFWASSSSIRAQNQIKQLKNTIFYLVLSSYGGWGPDGCSDIGFLSGSGTGVVTLSLLIYIGPELGYSMLHSTILHYTVLYTTILHCAIYCTILYYMLIIVQYRLV